MSGDPVFDATMRLLERAKDLGWSPRANGSYSRLLKFAEPVSDAVLTVLVPALCLDGPDGRHVKPGCHRHELSEDRLFLRLVVRPPASRMASLPVSLFGVRPDADVVLS